MEIPDVKRVVEALLLVSEDPLSRSQLVSLLNDEVDAGIDVNELIDEALTAIAADCETRGYELREVSSGYRFQICTDLSDFVTKFLMQKPRKYSQAMLETLGLIAYRQPITRGEIEEVRGVAVSTHTIRTLLDRGWVREIGTRESPGRPMLYGTTKSFLDYFCLNSLDELPPLSDVAELGSDALKELSSQDVISELESELLQDRDIQDTSIDES